MFVERNVLDLFIFPHILPFFFAIFKGTLNNKEEEKQ